LYSWQQQEEEEEVKKATKPKKEKLNEGASWSCVGDHPFLK